MFQEKFYSSILLQKSRYALSTLADWYNPAELKEVFFNILSAAMNSTEADAWRPNDRSEALFLYRLVEELADALPVLRQHLFSDIPYPAMLLKEH